MPTLRRLAFAGFQMETGCCIQQTVACGQSRLLVDHQLKFVSLQISPLLVQDTRFHLLAFLYPDNSSRLAVLWDLPCRRTDIASECSRSASSGSYPSVAVRFALPTFRSKPPH